MAFDELDLGHVSEVTRHDGSMAQFPVNLQGEDEAYEWIHIVGMET